MKKFTLRKIFIAGIFTLTLSIQSRAQLIVNDSVTAEDMVSAIAGGGVVFSNISFTGANESRGIFSCSDSCNLGISSGIVLTTGSAINIIGPNNINSATGVNNSAGDTDLTNILLVSTQDACVLQFDFITLSDSVVFNFRFGSEEYNEFVNAGFNDVFAFFISGPGISGNQNIALVPGTTTPVSIDNVNNGNSIANNPPSGPCMNCSYYENNSTGALTTQYDGMTTILTAVAANLQAGETYHLKMAIADVGDHSYDSGVLIEAGSFSMSGQPWLYADGLRVSSGTVYICPNGSVTLSAPSGFSYLWSNGSTDQSVVVSEEGAYSVEITGSNSDAPVFSNPINVVIDTLQIGDITLTLANDTLYSSMDDIDFVYSWTLNGLPLVGENNPWLHIAQNGCYLLNVQTPAGCNASIDTMCITVFVGINENSSNTTVSLFPNPFSSSCKMIFENRSKEKFILSLFDVTGRNVTQKIISESEVIIDRKNLASGIYSYQLRNGDGSKSFIGKIAVE
jgi:hypothetical protein